MIKKSKGVPFPNLPEQDSHHLTKYNYPDCIQKAVFDFRKIILAFYHKQKIGILLVGSTARGELCFEINEEGVTLFSDMEFIIAVEQVQPKLNLLIKEQVKDLTRQLNWGILFHFDYTYIKWKNLPKTEKKFFVFESKIVGLDLTLHSVKDKLPEVTLTNIDFKELNEVLLHRQHSIISTMPLISINPIAGLPTYYKLCLAKNCLDVTTWLTPYIAKKLIPGFANRLAIMKDTFSNQPHKYVLDLDDFAFLEECLLVRARKFDWQDSNTLVTKVIRLFNHATVYCLKENGLQSSQLSDTKTSIKLFNEYAFRSRGRQIVNSFFNINKLGITYTLKNSLLPTKGIRILFCNYMLKGLSHIIQGNDSGAFNEILQAEKILSSRVKIPRVLDSPKEKWVSLNYVYQKYLEHI